MDRALGQFWPRARSKIYEEPKKLVAFGLARAHAEDSRQAAPHRVHDHREGTTRARASGCPTADAGPVIEFESLVKVFYAEHGSKADLLATIAPCVSGATNETLATGYIADEYLDDVGPFPERMPWLILVGQFLDDFLAFVADWADWAEAAVESWPDDITPRRIPTSKHSDVTRSACTALPERVHAHDDASTLNVPRRRHRDIVPAATYSFPKRYMTEFSA